MVLLTYSFYLVCAEQGSSTYIWEVLISAFNYCVESLSSWQCSYSISDVECIVLYLDVRICVCRFDSVVSEWLKECVRLCEKERRTKTGWKKERLCKLRQEQVTFVSRKRWCESSHQGHGHGLFFATTKGTNKSECKQRFPWQWQRSQVANNKQTCTTGCSEI